MRAKTNGTDLYAAEKREYNQRALAMLPRLRALVQSAADPFDTAVRLAIAGNIIDFSITANGESLGLTSREIARQVRNAFSGNEALRQQRGRNEVTVRIRLPVNERNTEHSIENLMIRTPAGTFVPLFEVASVTRGRAFTSINRRDARRTVTVSADVEPISETGQIQATLNSDIMPELVRDFPGLTYGYQGRQANMKESTGGLMTGFILAMAAMRATCVERIRPP